MPKNYIHLTPRPRGRFAYARRPMQRAPFAKRLCSSACTISRELRRADAAAVYVANRAQYQALALRVKRRNVPNMMRFFNA